MVTTSGTTLTGAPAGDGAIAAAWASAPIGGRHIIDTLLTQTQNPPGFPGLGNDPSQGIFVNTTPPDMALAAGDFFVLHAVSDIMTVYGVDPVSGYATNHFISAVNFSTIYRRLDLLSTLSNFSSPIAYFDKDRHRFAFAFQAEANVTPNAESPTTIPEPSPEPGRIVVMVSQTEDPSYKWNLLSFIPPRCTPEEVSRC